MRWSGATGAIARGKRVSTGCGRKRRSARVWRWICGVKPKPKAGNKPWQHFIVHGLDKPGSSATVSGFMGSTRVIAHAARRVAEHLDAYLFLQDCFGLDVTFVPMPRSSPRRAGFLWPAERICACLLAEGLGRDILRCLERTQPVQQASRAAMGQRPDPPAHYASITVRASRSRVHPRRITLVDDVITRG